MKYALVAQLDRVLASEAKGHEFKSHRAHHKGFRGFKGSSMKFLPIFLPILKDIKNPSLKGLVF